MEVFNTEIKLGQKVRRQVYGCYLERGAPAKLLAGYVSYIHPKGRFYTITFPLAHGALRESYYFADRGGIYGLEKRSNG